VLPNPESAGEGVPLPVDVSHASGGGRIVTKLAGTKIEAGYLYDGKATANRPYVSFQGSLLLDWSIAASAAIPGTSPAFDEWDKTIVVSCGLSSLLYLDPSGSFSFRLEALLRPYAIWDAASAPGTPPDYGIYAYADIAYAPDDTLSFLLRSIVSPVDASAVVFGGAYWNVYQGFTLGFFASAMLGESGDTFGWGRDGDLSFIASIRYVFGTEAGGGFE
jgi:hypothetical protein